MTRSVRVYTAPHQLVTHGRVHRQVFHPVHVFPLTFSTPPQPVIFKGVTTSQQVSILAVIQQSSAFIMDCFPRWMNPLGLVPTYIYVWGRIICSDISSTGALLCPSFRPQVQYRNRIFDCKSTNLGHRNTMTGTPGRKLNSFSVHPYQSSIGAFPTRTSRCNHTHHFLDSEPKAYKFG